ncbi:MAG TPA: hypothetical protein VNI01_02775 [Elusimicrobiota bacterium]|jgi:hypothetical protein|nr:hypothetical protein [Elusimicrobiota bacterium]
MNALTLGLVFATAAAVSGCVLVAFSRPMDAVLLRILSGELAAAWSKYAKFAVLVASFSGGLRINQLEALSMMTTPVSANRCLMEVFQAVSGTLQEASWALLLFFGGTLIAYAVTQVYNHLRDGRHGRTEDFARHPVGR